MLSIGNDVLKQDDYYIVQKYSGLDELHLSVSVHDENYKYIAEEVRITERTTGQTFRVISISMNGEEAEVKAVLDLNDFYTSIQIPYSNGSATLFHTVSNVLPEGWTFLDQSGSSIRRTIEADAATAMTVIDAARDTYSVVFVFDTGKRRITAYSQSPGDPVGSFLMRELNLKNMQYYGKSESLVTRLYAYGKDGMTFASINGGKGYVEDFSYTTDVLCGYWKDERYTDAESLLDAAKKKLAASAVPSRSYECSVQDLAMTDPERYGFLSFDMYSVCTLIDDINKTRVNHQVVERTVYPYYPEKNGVTLSTVAPAIQNQVKVISNQIENKASLFWQIMQATTAETTSIILKGDGGYVVLDIAENNRIYQILIMDTPDKATAKNVWRWNMGGLGFSSNGYNGPFDKIALTMDGQINASMITTGHLLADIIQGGTLTDLTGSLEIDLNTGYILINNDTAKYTLRLTPIGILVTDETGMARIHVNPVAGFVYHDGENSEHNSTMNSAGVQSYYVVAKEAFAFQNRQASWTYDSSLGKYILTAEG